MKTTDPVVLAIHGAFCEDSVEECLDCFGPCVKAAREIKERADHLAEAFADPEGVRLAEAAADLATVWGKEWGVVVGEHWYKFGGAEEKTARGFASLHGGTLNSRVVGPWTEDRT